MERRQSPVRQQGDDGDGGDRIGLTLQVLGQPDRYMHSQSLHSVRTRARIG